MIFCFCFVFPFFFNHKSLEYRFRDDNTQKYWEIYTQIVNVTVIKTVPYILSQLEEIMCDVNVYFMVHCLLQRMQLYM